ncbi:alpha-mannosidase [Proteinivorax tanatarense]|uniref:Alpha-mannosidase n=1 Tax=Proteinivorax tanatarense TaxID=1260629 RepID=A0AAU7VJS9_9FIRM
MFFKIEKLENRINELDRLRYKNIKMIESFKTYNPTKGEENRLPTNYSTEVLTVNDHWAGRDKYLWLNTNIKSIPLSKDSRQVLFLDLGRTGGGNNSGFEALLYLNKEPFQAVDCNHKEVILPNAGDKMELDILLWSGLEGGGHPQQQFYRIKEAWHGLLDKKIDSLYYLSKAVLQSIKVLDENDPSRAKLLTSLNDAFLVIDWTEPQSEEFYQSVYKSLDILKAKVNLKSANKQNINIHTIGHSHIDLAWLWRVKHTKEKAKRTFTTVLRLMELYDDYTFLQSQPQLYQWIKDEEPELYKKIKEKVANGQWQVEGGMWVEADCNIPSGESLVRQLLYGKKFYLDEFGKDSKVLWLPDVFGYSWALPQILKKSGIETFVTTKISWNQYNRMPHDTFKWKGIDGSEVLTHFITTPEPGRDENSWFYTYNGLITAETLKGIWNKYRDKEINNDLLLAYGYGDGGGGVNREMLEMKNQYNKVDGMPKVQSTNAEKYFDKLHENLDHSNGYLHTWDGELYLEYHRGTYTSQAKVKQKNRQLENEYRKLELISVWEGFKNKFKQYPKELIEKGWKKILLNQFHDIIPGSSIKEVYEDCHKDYQQAEEIKNQIMTNKIETIVVKEDNVVSYFHPLQYKGAIVVKVPKENNPESLNFWLEDKPLTAQKLENGDFLVLVDEARPLSFGNIALKEAETEKSNQLSSVELHKQFLSTPYYEIKWDSQGQLTSIFDIEAGREVLKGKGNVFRIFEDKPMAHDAWDIDLFYKEKSSKVGNLKECYVEENGKIRTTIVFKWQWKNVSITQKMHCYSYTKRIDFETIVDWDVRQRLLKVEFPLDIRCTEAIYDIQFGNVTRPNNWNTSWDMARFESVGHKWSAISETDYGVALMNDSKYGYSNKDNVLQLSLLKGAVHPDPNADEGQHYFTYSIFPFGGLKNKWEVEKEAAYLNTPIEALSGGAKKEFTAPFIEIDKENVVLDAVKISEWSDNKIIVRFHEMEGARSKIKVKSLYEIDNWKEVNLIENESLSPLHHGPIELEFSPYEIKTIEVEFK